MAEPDPYTQCLEIMKCDEDDDCPGNALCLVRQCMCPDPNIGDDCRRKYLSCCSTLVYIALFCIFFNIIIEKKRPVNINSSLRQGFCGNLKVLFPCDPSDPCEDVRCGPNAECKLINGQPKCMCSQGYTGNPNSVFGCTDVNECTNNPCGTGAICQNEPGHYKCECPSGFEGDPAREGCVEVKSPGCGPTQPCPSGEQCVTDNDVAENVCVCRRGYTRDDPSKPCRDINECVENRIDLSTCGLNAICKNLPGSYDCQCPPGFVGNPFSICESKYCWKRLCKTYGTFHSREISQKYVIIQVHNILVLCI